MTTAQSEDEDETKIITMEDILKIITPPKFPICPTCGAENLPASRFCIFCGKAFDYKCPDCGQ